MGVWQRDATKPVKSKTLTQLTGFISGGMRTGWCGRKLRRRPGRALGDVYSHKEEFGRVNFTLLDSF